MDFNLSPPQPLHHLVDEILTTGILTRTQERCLLYLVSQKELTDREGQALGRFLNAFMRGDIQCG